MKKTRFRNGVRHSLITREKAAHLRREGKTHREIAKELGISLGSADLWTRGIILTRKQTEEIYARRNTHKLTPKEKERNIKRLRPFWKKAYTREDLIRKIKQFHVKNGRIPLKREFNSLRVFRDHFGSWNNAIIAAGFEPNPILFAKKFVSRDGHHCDSFTEKIIDDWFYEREVRHQRNWKYVGTKMTADFFIEPDVVVEFFGLAGAQKEYDALIQKKREFCEENQFQLLELYPKDLFPQNHLAEIFRGS